MFGEIDGGRSFFHLVTCVHLIGKARGGYCAFPVFILKKNININVNLLTGAAGGGREKRNL